MPLRHEKFVLSSRIHQHGSMTSSSKLENEPRSPGDDDDDEDLINPGSPTPFEDDASEDEVALELRSPLARLSRSSCPPEERTTPLMEGDTSNATSVSDIPDISAYPINSSAGSIVANESSLIETNGKSSAFSSPFLNLSPNIENAWESKTCSRELFLAMPQVTLASDMFSQIAVDAERNLLRPPLRATLFPHFTAGLPPRLPFAFNAPPLSHWNPRAHYPIHNSNGDYPSPFPHSLSIESLIAPKQSKRPASPSHSPPVPYTSPTSTVYSTPDVISPVNRTTEHIPVQSNLSLESSYQSQAPLLRSPSRSPLSKRLHMSPETESAEVADQTKKLPKDSEANEMPSFYPIKLQLRKNVDEQ